MSDAAIAAHDAHHGHEETPGHAHHFDTPEQQRDSGKLGMWVFLVTEILLFGGLFVAYGIYRAQHPEIFLYAHQYLDKTLGGINTIVLICSSLSMAMAVRAAQLGQQKLLKQMLTITLVCAFGFLGIKYVEYQHKWKDGLLPGNNFRPAAEGHVKGDLKAPPPAPAVKLINPVPADRSAIPPAAVGPRGLASEQHRPVDREHMERPKNTHIFFGIYFMMTGLHGFHVLGGMAAIAWCLMRARRGMFGPQYWTPVDLVGLYWHLVDLIWIFLFPLLYLIH